MPPDPGRQRFPVKVLAERIALFQALCADISEKAVRGSLKVSDVAALRDDLISIGNNTAMSSSARGVMNQAYARTDSVERYLDMDDPSHLSPLLQYTVKGLCEALEELKAKLEPTTPA